MGTAFIAPRLALWIATAVNAGADPLLLGIRTPAMQGELWREGES